MQFTKLFGIAALLVSVAACDTIDTDAERGAVGAAAGAGLSAATGNNPLTGAVIGGAAGVFCDDAGVCR